MLDIAYYYQRWLSMLNQTNLNDMPARASMPCQSKTLSRWISEMPNFDQWLGKVVSKKAPFRRLNIKT